MNNKNVQKKESTEKIRKKFLKNVRVGDLLIKKNRHGEIIVGWATDNKLSSYDNFCSIEWFSEEGRTYAFIGDALEYRENYLMYRKENCL